MSETGLDLKTVIDVLKNARTTDWEEIEIEGERVKTKTDFEVKVQWQKVKLYEMEALEFLSFAKQDLEEGSVKGNVNGLCNAAQAVKCRTDELLKLLNLSYFAGHENWSLPYKLEVLERFGITAPNVLRSLITSKRNILEHEYIRPKGRQEVKDAADIAELFLKATDQYVEKGYVASVMVQTTKWLIVEGTKLIPYISEFDDFPYHSIIGFEDRYDLIFDLDNGNLTVEFPERERYRALKSMKTGKPRERSSHYWKDKPPTTIPIRDCAKEDIRELMILLREKGK